MNAIPPPEAEITKAPPAFRDALAELVQIGLRVARMVGQVADAETALAAAASQAGAAEGVSALATSLAEAIEADRAAAAAAEMRQTVVARAEAVASAFARVSRSIRLSVMLAERLDRGWARHGATDDHPAMTRRQMARAARDATGPDAEDEPARALAAALRERLDAPDTEAGIGDRAAEDIMAAICRYLRLDPVRWVVRSPVPGAVSFDEAGETAPANGAAIRWQASPPKRRPDG